MTFAPLHMIAAGIGRLRRPAFDARAAVELARFGLPFFPATRFALAPSALLSVLNDVLINNRRIILELGSGYSSVYLAMALKNSSGRIITVDSNEAWLDQVMARATAAGVADRICPVLAPLTPIAGRDGAQWYDVKSIKKALDGDRVGLLLGDGPVALSKALKYARAPAVPMLKDVLNDRYAIFLDDIHRLSHAKIASDWSDELSLRFSLVHARGGFAYAAQGAAFDPII